MKVNNFYQSYVTSIQTSLSVKVFDLELLNNLKNLSRKYFAFSNNSADNTDYEIYISDESIKQENILNYNLQSYVDKILDYDTEIYIDKIKKTIFIIVNSCAKAEYVKKRDKYIFRFIRKVILVLELSKGKYFLHSGCVEYNGKGIGIVGNKFSGKTTTIVNLLKDKEFSYISNDKIIIEFKDNILQAFALPIAIGIRCGTFFKVLNEKAMSLPPEDIDIDRLDLKRYISSWNVETFFATKSLNYTHIKLFIMPNYKKDSKQISTRQLSEMEAEVFLKTQFLSADAIGESHEYLTDETLLVGENNDGKRGIDGFVRKYPIYEICYNEFLTEDFMRVVKGYIDNYG